MSKINIKSLNYSELLDEILKLNLPKFRAKQIYDWLHSKFVPDFSSMSNLSKDLQKVLDENFFIENISLHEKLIDKNDNTIKYLYYLPDGNIIECVLMKYNHGYAVCISTQVGCKMGCTFCASTIGGLVRNLTVSELLSQIYEIKKDLDERISNIVLMGSGEPLENYSNVLKFIEIINYKDGLNIGQRHITLSTCGLIDKINDLADENLQINLAISLHAPNSTIRDSIMPISKKNDFETLLLSCKNYAEKTKRRITFEYALIKGVNDLPDCAKELAKNLKYMLCHVNLIPVNAVKERDYEKTNDKNIENFAKILQNKGLEVTIRRSLGSSINAACGQLRKSRI